jgi:large subunit ribosomal protein L4
MQAPVLNTSGTQVSTIDLPADIFEAKINVGLMHQYVVMQNANARQGTHKTLGRADINRTKAKWYRQKGTGRARHGNRAAPIFVGGGRAHPKRPHDYIQKMPQKMRHAALKSALSALLRDGQLVFVDNLTIEQPKTKLFKSILTTLVGDTNRTLVLLPGRSETLELAIRNLEEAKYLHAMYLNVKDLLTHDKVIITLSALDVIKSLLGKKEAAAE